MANSSMVTLGTRSLALLCLVALVGCARNATPTPATEPQPDSLRAAAAIHSKLDLDVQNLEYDDLEHDLGTMPGSAERDLFAGILDNRTGHIEESIRLIQAALPETKLVAPQRMGVALESLADDYVKSFRYADASSTYQELIANYAGQLEPGERQDVLDDTATLKLLAAAPPQTIRWDSPVDLPTRRSPIGSFDVDLTVNGVAGPWILDTGANFSVLSASYARRLGLVASAGTAQTKGSTGAENPLHVGLIPEMRIGGAVLNNVVALIMPDENLSISNGSKEHYQINAVIGFPVFQSLGKVTFTRTGRFKAANTAADNGPSSRMFMDKLTPLLECGTHGKQRLFAFDTGANTSDFFAPYYREFPQDFAKLKLSTKGFSGAGGAGTQPVYIVNIATLGVAGQDIALHHVPVFPRPLGAGSDSTYGNLGRDLVANFESFTIDFAQLRFFLGKPTQPSGTKPSEH